MKNKISEETCFCLFKVDFFDHRKNRLDFQVPRFFVELNFFQLHDLISLVAELVNFRDQIVFYAENKADPILCATDSRTLGQNLALC